MSGVNKAIIVGRLSADPRVRELSNGTVVATFSIPTSESWTDKNDGTKKEVTEWHRIVAYRKLGEVCKNYLEKGSMIYVEGKLQTRMWLAANGNKNTITEIIASNMTMLGSNKKEEEEEEISFDFGANKISEEAF